MTTQEMVAFVRRGYDAYNAHQSDPNWLDYATEDMAQDGEVVDIPSGMIFRGPDGLKQFLLGDKELGGERLPSSLFALSTCFSSSV